MQHNLRGSPFRCRGTAYQALVRLQLEYCYTIWDPSRKGETESNGKLPAGQGTNMAWPASPDCWRNMCGKTWQTSGDTIDWPLCIKSWTTTWQCLLRKSVLGGPQDLPVGLPSPATPPSYNGHVPVASHPPCGRAVSSALFPSGIAYSLPQRRPIHY